MPVYGSHGRSYDELEIGRRLKAARQQCGLTLRDLAALTGLSTAVLSQLENERRPLDVGQGLAIADALRLTIDELVSDDSVLPYQVVRGEDLRSRRPRHVQLISAGDRVIAHQNRFHPLAELFVGRRVEPVHAFVAPGPETGEPTFCCHHEQEFLLVLRGAVEVSLKTPQGLERHELGPGDSVYFWSNLPHAIRSLDTQGAETLEAFTSAPGSLQSERSWLVSARAEMEVDDPDRLKAIGRKMRLCRMATGQSVSDVAAVTGVTPRHIAAAESGRRPLTMSAMVKLAQLAGYPLREFIGEPRACAPYAFVQRSAEVKSLPPTRRRNATSPGNLFRSLSRGFPTPLMLPYFIQVPSSDTVASPHEHHGEEFTYVLSGQLELIIGAGQAVRTELLRAGDSCYFDATVPHMLKGRPLNPYDQMSAEVIDVFWCPLGEEYLFQSS